MAFPIDSPLPVFYDRNGSVLDAGFVYIGTANTNPETNPIAVYWDAALTVPAAQPLRTVRGFIARNGAPSALYVPSEYSIVVRDRNRQLLLNEPTSSTLAASGGSAQIGFIQAGTGAVVTNVQEELRYFVRPEQFGAVADGVTDDLVPIQEAITYANSVGLPVVFSGKTYALSNGIVFDLSRTSYIGNGSRLDFASAPLNCNCVTVRSPSALLKTQHYIEGFELRGFDGRTSPITNDSPINTTQAGFFFEGSALGEAGISHIRNCSLIFFQHGLRWGNFSFLQKFVEVSIRNCDVCVYFPSGLTEFGENISFHQCVMYSARVGFDITRASFYLYGCSLDYLSRKFITLGPGTNLSMFGGHMEGDMDNDYWFDIPVGPDSSFNFYGLEFALAVGSNKTAFPLGFSDANSATSINFHDCEFTQFNGTNYPFPFLVQGYGRANGLAYFLGGTGAVGDAIGSITHTRLNLLSDGGFEQTALRDFFNTAAGTAATTTAAARTGTRSMMLAPAAGQTTVAEAQFSCKPGDAPIFVFYGQGSGFIADSMFFEVQYLDAFFNALGAFGSSVTAANIPATWSRFQIRGGTLAPIGTAYVRLRIIKASAAAGNSDGGGVFYVDDAYAQILGSGGNNDSKEYRFSRNGVVSNNTFRVPNNYAIEGIKIFNTTANAVSGGIRIGTTSGGTQVATSIAVGANADLFIPASALTLSFFSSTANQTTFFEAVTAWNSASLNVSYVCRRVG